MSESAIVAVMALVYSSPDHTLRIPQRAFVDVPMTGWELVTHDDVEGSALVVRMRPRTP